MTAMAWWGVVAASAAILAVAVVAWPRRRYVSTTGGARWVRNEDGLREYVATPWLQGERR